MVAVRGLTETLRIEVEAASHRVGVSSVRPGGIKTIIATNARATAEAQGLPVTDADRRRQKTYNEKLLKMPPEQAAEVILSGVQKGRARIMVGTDAKIVDLFVRLFPGSYARGVRAFDKRLK